MPIYEYECLVCKERFERRQSIHDEPIKECFKCGGKARKVIHPVGIIFKGSGFYATDSRKPHYGEGGKASTESTESSESKEDKKEESKADAKPAKDETKAGTKAVKDEAKVGAGSTTPSAPSN